MTVLGGRYEIGELLGAGGMAEVYRARDEVLGRDVAVKVFRISDLDAGGQRRTGEIRLLAGLSHAGLVTVFDAGEDAGSTYLVMELVEGTTLRRRLDSGPLTAEETARLGAELAGALAYVHSRGIVHRDVKPANILLAVDGTAKLTDFGVAKLLDGTRITTAGTTVGTPNYLSPEQTTGEPVSGASDVYSLGLVLLECLTGTVAFPGHGVEAAVARLHRDPQIPAQLGPMWMDLLTRMTARDPAARPDPAAVAVGLTAALDDLPTASTATMVLDTAPVGTPERRARWLPVAAAAVLVAAVALGIALASSGSDKPGSAPSTSPVTSVTAPLPPPVEPTTTPPTTPRTTVVVTATHSAPAPQPKPPKKKSKSKKDGGHDKP